MLVISIVLLDASLSNKFILYTVNYNVIFRKDNVFFHLLYIAIFYHGFSKDECF
jgi:hypothetical protein